MHLARVNWSTQDVPIDVNIRNWVLFPIFLLMMFFSLIKEFGTRLMKAEPKRSEKALSINQAMIRSNLIRSNGGWLTESALRRRKAFFLNQQNGIFPLHLKEVASQNSQNNNNNNPLAAPGMPGTDMSMLMQQQMSMLTVIVPQMLMMGIVSFFFSGFVMVKIPFPLSLRFKAMTQHGIELSSLDVSYVSSFSWYMLVNAGLQGLLSLFLSRQAAMSDLEATQQQAVMPAAMDQSKIYAAESESLTHADYTFNLENVERRLLAQHRL